MAPSQSKHKLYIGNIPKDLNKEAFKEQLDAVVKGGCTLGRNMNLTIWSGLLDVNADLSVRSG